MPNIKGTLFFSQDNPFGQACGWSESYILTTAATLREAIPQLNTLAAARYALCGSGVTMPYARVSLLGLRNDSQISVPGLVPNSPNNLKRADIPGSGVLVRIEGVDDLFIARRSLFLKGNPDVSQETDKLITDDPVWNAAWRRFQQELVSGSYGFMVIDRSGANPQLAVTAVSTASPAVFTIPGNTFAVGGLVRLTGIRLAPVPPATRAITVSGIFQVATRTGDNVTFVGLNTSSAYAGGGQARRYEKVQKVINKAILRRYGVHRVGRPFDLARGRVARRAP